MNAGSNGETIRYLKIDAHREFTHFELIVHRKHTLATRTPPHARTQGVVPELLTCGDGGTDGQRYHSHLPFSGTQEN
jgi:hypothetical protein